MNEQIGWMAAGAVVCMAVQVLYKWGLRWYYRSGPGKNQPRGRLN